MSEHRFLASLKSTLDKHGMDLANSLIPPLPLVDLDDTVNVTAFLQSGENGLVWEFLTLEPLPRDPLYSVSFRIGARTTNDPSNYTLLDFTGRVKAAFPEQQGVTVFDYTGATRGDESLGELFVAAVMVDPQQFDRESGIRMVTVSGRAMRWDGED